MYPVNTLYASLSLLKSHFCNPLSLYFQFSTSARKVIRIGKFKTIMRACWYEKEEFLREHGDLIRAIRKAPAMSNLDLVDMYKINLIWDDIKFSLQHGLKNRAEQKSLELYRLYVDSRGFDGFGSKVMVTQHNIITEEKMMKTKGKRGMGQWFKKPKIEQEVPDVYPMGSEGMR